VDGYSVVDAPPSMVADLRAARDELLPSMREAFRDTQVKKVELGGRPVGHAVAHTLDPVVVDDAAFTGFMMKGMSPALSGPSRRRSEDTLRRMGDTTISRFV
jgi:hypothetical protein